MGIASFIGALVSAPAAVAGATAVVAGDTVKQGAGGPNGIPTLCVAGDILSSAGEHTLNVATGMRDGIGDMGSLMPHVNFAALGFGICGKSSSLTPGDTDIAQALVRAPAIDLGPKTYTTDNHFDRADLFTAAVSAPVFKNPAPVDTNIQIA